jgi:NAD+ synthase (glutamine-hydrolysing)
MATKNSSEETRALAEAVAQQIGSTHFEVNIDETVAAFEAIITKTFNKQPKFKVHGGSATENLALQNVQARTRMVLAYMMAQLAQWGRGKEYIREVCRALG